MTEMHSYKDEIETKVDETNTLSLEDTKVDTGDSVDAGDDNFDGVIDLTATRKKRFQVDLGFGATGVLELNTSDMSVINRLEDLYPKLEKLNQEASLKQINGKDSDSASALEGISVALRVIDTKMREIVDEIFDSNVCEVCAPDGSMFDPFNGEFRYEHIIETLAKLYETNIRSEFTSMSNRLKKKTAKYTKGK